MAELKDYDIVNFRQEKDEGLRKKVIDCWRRNGLGESFDVEKRSNQALMVVVKDDLVVGLSTVYMSKYKGELYHIFRMFIQPSDRGWHLAHTVFTRTCNFLEKISPNTKARGILITTENVKLKEEGMHKYLKRNNCKLLGKNKANEEVWVYLFSGKQAN